MDPDHFNTIKLDRIGGTMLLPEVYAWFDARSESPSSLSPPDGEFGRDVPIGHDDRWGYQKARAHPLDPRMSGYLNPAHTGDDSFDRGSMVLKNGPLNRGAREAAILD
jgi:hypothetical protein